MSFSTLGLSAEIIRAVAEKGYTKPTPIQSQAIPAVLLGGDILAGAQTGTGKTASFTLPLLHRLTDSRNNSQSSPNSQHIIRALILAPTRELAAQVQESVRDYGKYLNLRSLAMFGGVSFTKQKKSLQSGVDILVSTPGRLLDHVQQGTVNLKNVEILVLDEADRMLDMGFIHDIRRILALLPKQRQNLMFFATFSDKIKSLATGLLNRPTTIEVAPPNRTADTIAQKIYQVDGNKKRQLLSHLIKKDQWYQVLVFTRTKHGADRLVRQLGEDRIQALAIHGNKSQPARTHALGKFKNGTLQVLVATDIAARGLDISELPHVVNFDLPNVPEDYVHRIGRTGRAGAKGEAVSLVCADEYHLLAAIEKTIAQKIPREAIAGFEPGPQNHSESFVNDSGHQDNSNKKKSKPRRSGYKPTTKNQTSDRKLSTKKPRTRKSA